MNTTMFALSLALTGCFSLARFFTSRLSKKKTFRAQRLHCFLLDGLLWSVIVSEPDSQEHLDGPKVLCNEPKSRSSDVWDPTDMLPGLPVDIADVAAREEKTKNNNKRGDSAQETGGSGNENEHRFCELHSGQTSEHANKNKLRRQTSTLHRVLNTSNFFG